MLYKLLFFQKKIRVINLFLYKIKIFTELVIMTQKRKIVIKTKKNYNDKKGINVPIKKVTTAEVKKG